MSDVSAECFAYRKMSERFQMADALLGGTFEMREKGVKYLPEFYGERAEEYGWRLGNAVLRPLFRKASEFLVGHMFREPIDTKNVDARLLPYLEDMDRSGTDIDTYAAKQARLLLTHGLCYSYTDFPRVQEGIERDLSKEGVNGELRPYVISIHPSDFFFASAEDVNGIEVLREIRWKVHSTIVNGFEQDEVEEIRRVRYVGEEPDQIKKSDGEIFTPNPGSIVWELWRANSEGANWALVDAGDITGIDYIPLRIGYSDREDFLVSRPMLEGVAHKNLEHWRAASDHNAIVQMSRFPVFYATGVDEEEAKKIDVLGPHVKLVGTNPDARFGYLEASGSAVEQSFKDLERIAREADEQSIEALYKSGSDTATGRRIDLLESLSPAQQTAFQVEFHLNQVLADFGRRLGVSDPGYVEIDKDFGYGEDEQRIIDALHKARALGDVSRTYYLKRLQEVGVIGDDVDPEELSDEAQAEADALNPMLDAGTGDDTMQGDTLAAAE